MCRFFVVPGNDPVLLGMPDIGILDILTINCNTIDTQIDHQKPGRSAVLYKQAAYNCSPVKTKKSIQW